jgi:prepilin-type N-terminal cleavage/methylation domain-containing protein
MQRARTASSLGFTLIEVLVSLVILATGIVAVLRAFETSAVALGESRAALHATELLRRLAAEAEAGETLPPAGRAGASFDAGWEREVLREPLALAGSNRLEQVTITVWRQGTDQRYSVSTYIRKP